jgi:hypothetical protein
MANAVSNMGQDLGRAASALKSPEQKASAYTSRLQALQLERGTLENTLLRNQIINEQRVAGTPPTLPAGPRAALIPGQGNARNLKIGSLRISPKPGDSQAQDWENEYGEIADLIGGARLARDADAPVRKWFNDEFEKARRGEPGLFTRDYDDFQRISGWLRGKRNLEPTRSSGW